MAQWLGLKFLRLAIFLFILHQRALDNFFFIEPSKDIVSVIHFSNINLYQNHMEALSKHKLLDPILRFSDSVSLGETR